MIKHVMKAYSGTGLKIHEFCTKGTKLSREVSFMLRLFYTWAKSPLYPLDGRLGRPQIQFGRDG
jgi:hypothetical protein